MYMYVYFTIFQFTTPVNIITSMDSVEARKVIVHDNNQDSAPKSLNFTEEAPISPAGGGMNQYEQIQAEEAVKRRKLKPIPPRAGRFACGLILFLVISAFVVAGVYFSQNSAYESVQKSYSESNQLNLGLTAVFLIVNDEHKGLQSINSFLKNNLCNKIIIASHKNLTGKTGENLKNATWVIERRPQYDLYFVDDLIKKVDTEFFFFSTTEWEYYDNLFVDFSIKILKQFPEIGQILPNLDESKFMSTNTRHEGFSFLPGVHRRKDYLLAKDGYPAISDNVGVLNEAEKKISNFYLSKGLYMLLSPENFNIFRVGTKPQLFLEEKSDEEKMEQKTLKDVEDAFYSNKRKVQPKIELPQSSSKIPFEKIFSTAQYKEEMNGMKNLFLSSYHNAQHFSSFEQYLIHNRAHKVLLITCDQGCRAKYEKVSPQDLAFKSVNHISEVLDSNVQEVYDWISSQSLEGFISSIIEKNLQINLYTNFGVSLRWPIANYDSTAIETIIEYFISKGFHYDEAKSLTFRKVEGKMMLIFVKGQKKINLIKQKEPENKNVLGIQTVFKLKQNIVFMREWMIYHIHMGFEKFYLYDNSNSLGSNLDPKSSRESNKFGMAFDCIKMSEQELANIWRYIWTQFYEYIVYVVWEPKDEQGKTIYGQVESQHDYLFYYKDVVRYTLFIDIDQLLFSPEKKQLIPYLNHYSENRISSIKFKQRRFLNRFCAPNKRMSEIIYYFPEDSEKTEGVKVIAETASFLPFENIHEGRATRGRQIVIPEDQFRINHYNFQKDGLERAKASGYDQAWQFQIDNGMIRYKDIMDKACTGKCSQIFSTACPASNLWSKCLDINKVYSMYGTSNIIRPDVTPLPPQQKPSRSHITPQRKKPSYVPPRPNPNPVAPAGNKMAFGQFLGQMQTWLKTPGFFYEFELLKNLKELPICLLVIPSEKHSEQELSESIALQDYSNYRQFTPAAEETEGGNINFFYYRDQIKEKCVQNTLVMFISVPLKAGALKYINENLQKYHAWVAYTKDGNSIQVMAFFYRIYELLSTNDFKKTNQFALKTNNREVLTVSLLQLCVQSNKEVQKQNIVDPTEFTYFSALRSSKNVYDRIVYTKLLRLSQDIDISVGQFERMKAGIGSLKVAPILKLSVNHMFRAADREQQWYLPRNHTIQQRQFEQYSESYKINEYSDISKQVRFCVTILSHNNIQNNRYIKVMKSIVMQEYENYHIVFIDDNSDDKNMVGTIEYMKSINFPQDRIVYIQNKRRNYATYNIMNAAYNFCHEDDVQMLMDGDDEFIGKYAFQVMNSAYQQKQDLFVAYSNYKTNYYGFGRSRGMSSEFDHSANGRRSYISLFGPIRTWKVKVVYNIPLLHHKMQNGEWLDTVYDDALSHPLFEISSVSRVRYINEILYEYNIRYGDNDDSTSAKLKHRGEVYKHVLSIPVLPKVATLDGTVKDSETAAELTQGEGTRYEVRKA